MPTFQEIQQTLTRCMQEQPAANYALSADASQLATVFAEMMFLNEQERGLSSLTGKQLAAYERWK